MKYENVVKYGNQRLEENNRAICYISIREYFYASSHAEHPLWNLAREIEARYILTKIKTNKKLLTLLISGLLQ